MKQYYGQYDATKEKERRTMVDKFNSFLLGVAVTFIIAMLLRRFL
jgi:hypothetical protein